MKVRQMLIALSNLILPAEFSILITSAFLFLKENQATLLHIHMYSDRFDSVQPKP